MEKEIIKKCICRFKSLQNESILIESGNGYINLYIHSWVIPDGQTFRSMKAISTYIDGLKEAKGTMIHTRYGYFKAGNGENFFKQIKN